MFTCVYCGIKPEDGAELHVDHIWPKIKGGKDVCGNLITACKKCNLGKSSLAMVKENIERYQKLAAKRNEERGYDDLMNVNL